MGFLSILATLSPEGHILFESNKSLAQAIGDKRIPTIYSEAKDRSTFDDDLYCLSLSKKIDCVKVGPTPEDIAKFKNILEDLKTLKVNDASLSPYDRFDATMTAVKAYVKENQKDWNQQVLMLLRKESAERSSLIEDWAKQEKAVKGPTISNSEFKGYVEVALIDVFEEETDSLDQIVVPPPPPPVFRPLDVLDSSDVDNDMDTDPDSDDSQVIDNPNID